MRIRDGVPFGTIAGFPLYLATSFPLGVIFGAGWALRASHTGEMVERLFIVLFAIASVLAHELAHASVARSLGFPVRHIALTGYGGYAEFWFNASSRWRECAIAFAGPAANLLIALIAWVTLILLRADDVAWHDPLHIRIINGVLWFNLAVGAFNLLPGLPLDGGHIVRAILSNWMSRGRAGWIAAWLGVALGAGIIALAATQNNLLLAAIGAFLAGAALLEKYMLRYD